MHRSKEIRLKQAYFRYSIIRHVWACYDRIMMKLLSVAYITRIYYNNIIFGIIFTDGIYQPFKNPRFKKYLTSKKREQ